MIVWRAVSMTHSRGGCNIIFAYARSILVVHLVASDCFGLSGLVALVPVNSCC
jgi:hypothetical protein